MTDDDDLFEPAEASVRWPAQHGVPSTLHELGGVLTGYEHQRPRTQRVAIDDDDLFEPAEASVRWPAQHGIPSTLHELRGVLIEHEHQRPRTQQVALGPSELGTPCAQQIARKLHAGPQPPAQEPAWAPFQGSAVHVSMNDVIAFWNAREGRERWLPIARLEVADGITGEADAYDTDHEMVVDWKHVGVTALKELRDKGTVSQEYRVQAHLYGRGYALLGRPVKAVRLVLLARSWKFDDSEEWTEPYNEALALEAIERYRTIKTHMDAGGSLLDIRATPSSKCWWCPFRQPGRPADLDGCPGK